MTRILIPKDVATLAIGAEKVAAKIATEAQERGLALCALGGASHPVMSAVRYLGKISRRAPCGR